jgi:hypothetical protein
MAKQSTFTQRCLMSLISEIAERRDHIPHDIRVTVEALAKEHGLATYADRVLRAE